VSEIAGAHPDGNAFLRSSQGFVKAMWHKAVLRRDAIRSQVIDMLEEQEIKETPQSGRLTRSGTEDRKALDTDELLEGRCYVNNRKISCLRGVAATDSSRLQIDIPRRFSSKHSR